MSLNEFLGDSGACTLILRSTKHSSCPRLTALGSWADEMDAVPTGRKLPTAFYLVRVFIQLAYHIASGIPEESRSRLSDAPDRGQCLCTPCIPSSR